MKGQDILVLLKLSCWTGETWSYAALADALGMSASEAHAAVRRAEEAGLYSRQTRRPHREALREFLVHGVRYVFPARPGAIVQGLPTSYAAPPLNQKICFHDREAPVMPLAKGPVRGPEIVPLYPSAPRAASHDDRLYQLLALVDALRTGRAQDRKIAGELLTDLLAS